jgi:hypothetical protein
MFEFIFRKPGGPSTQDILIMFSHFASKYRVGGEVKGDRKKIILSLSQIVVSSSTPSPSSPSKGFWGSGELVHLA